MKAEHIPPPQKTLTRSDHHLKQNAPGWAKFLPVIPQIQVTRNCNLGCDYCFQEHSKGIIELSTVKTILNQVIAHNLKTTPQCKCIKVYWHGGEPLLAGIGFFKSILDLEKLYPNLTFENRIQTNGTLMTNELAQFFAENHFQIGFSLDGPRKIHNQHRRFRQSGDGTFVATMEGVKRYRRYAGLERVAIIAVITRTAINQAREIFEFFKTLRAEVQLDLYDLRSQDIVQPINTLSHPMALEPSPAEIGKFLIDLFDLWFYDQDAQVEFKELRQELKMILQPEIDLGDPFHKKRCDFKRLIFDPKGQVFSCDQWLNDETMVLGDIHKDSIESILVRKTIIWEDIKRALRKSGETMACGTCEWGRQCGGGCLTCMKYNALLLQSRAQGLPDSQWSKGQLPAEWSKIKGETYYCDGLRAFRQHVRKAVQREMTDAK